MSIEFLEDLSETPSFDPMETVRYTALEELTTPMIKSAEDHLEPRSPEKAFTDSYLSLNSETLLEIVLDKLGNDPENEELAATAHRIQELHAHYHPNQPRVLQNQ